MGTKTSADESPRVRAVRPLDAVSDADLVVRATLGSSRAFGLLYERHARMVGAILLARAPASELHDLRQDVFAAALRQLAGLRDPAAFSPWIAGIARRVAAGHYRGLRVTEPLAADTAGASPPRVEAAAAVRAIGELPEAYRETVALRLIAGMTGPEIATRTGLTPGSVRVNLCRGIKLLRARLGGADDA